MSEQDSKSVLAPLRKKAIIRPVHKSGYELPQRQNVGSIPTKDLLILHDYLA